MRVVYLVVTSGEAPNPPDNCVFFQPFSYFTAVEKELVANPFLGSVAEPALPQRVIQEAGNQLRLSSTRPLAGT
jgi:hypothetical protein